MAGRRLGIHWGEEETSAMLQRLWTLGAGQSVMPSAHLKTSRIFRRVAQYLTQEGYPRTSGQCRAKFKRLKAAFFDALEDWDGFPPRDAPRVLETSSSEEERPAAAQPPQGPLTVSSGDMVSAGEQQAAQPQGPVHVPSGDAGEGASTEGRGEDPIMIASSAGSGPGQMSTHKDAGTCHGCAVLRRRVEEFETAVDNRFNQILGLINTLTEVVEGLRADVSLQGTVQPGAAGLPP
ncbi:UNVERIFIED_CONTAM: hypothetical protein K2H54_017169 [Gekko kuhli]